ncbi:MAG: hypothetical protein BBJ57_07460 [Desulfobacterales bacterium PC51MH44]|nr:MAG: hypothetical protein BBJ57_07460 [Desulfobacterales bacterium PC51MH44]
MSTTLFNPTNENLKAQHSGVTIRIAKFPEKGHMVLVEDARARHILNILAPRGLTTLDYGDEGDAKKLKAKDGRQRNKEFKIKQIVDFNQLQQANEAGKIPYSHPAPHLKEYSDELGLDLLKPYELPTIDKGKISKLKTELEEKDIKLEEQGQQMRSMQGQISELTALVKQVVSKGKPAKVDTAGDEVGGDNEVLKFKQLNKAHFTTWMKKNWNEIPNYPAQVQEEINVRHEKLFGKPFPESKPE